MKASMGGLGFIRVACRGCFVVIYCRSLLVYRAIKKKSSRPVRGFFGGGGGEVQQFEEHRLLSC